MQVGQQQVSRIISNGLPQGDVLSPTLFNLYTTGLHILDDENTTLLQFADDFALITRAKTIEQVEIKAQQQLTRFVTKAMNLNLQVNPTKTKVILFHGGRKKLNINVGNQQLEVTTTHKYLGIQIDRFLKFGGHIRQVQQSIQERLKMLKIISGARGGGHPQTMTLVYNGLLRSYAEYGSSIINNTSQTHKDKIQVTLNAGLRKSTGCCKTTPRNTLLAIAAQEPWEFRSNYVANKEIAKAIYYKNPLYSQLVKVIDYNGDLRKLSFMEQLFLEHREIFESISPMIQTPIRNVSISTDIGIRTTKSNTNTRILKQSVLGILVSKYQNHHRVYTDASKTSNSCGVGIYLETNKRKISLKLEKETCIMTAEIIAIRIAVDEITRSGLQKSVILTDSLSSCKVLENSLNTKHCSAIIDNINEACEKQDITVQWIPSHIGLVGNDIADELAKEGAEKADAHVRARQQQILALQNETY
ncbi:uncharacterized protein LOC129742779 [Uranotaenia lowii]|uniref:uncharacterized protein LOC129742779 n=1 Tax=Uranotaenia lowii TaxID=190385 RepID=UPI00247AB9A7|nr:uncharacterized protein LOC129742779 [Uranotaenia lowii]